MQKNNTPGFAACAIKGNKVIWSGAFGYADVETGTPMSIDAVINVASVSKTITSTAVMQLREKGLLQLDADINTYLPFSIRNPNFPETPITIQQLLTHTSSIKDGPAYYESYSCGDPEISLKEWIINYLMPDGKFYNKTESYFNWKPDSCGAYSNVAYGLLGYLVEEITNKPFYEYCSENIFMPLGMIKTSWHLFEVDTANLITPYAFLTSDSMNIKQVKKLAKKYNEQDTMLLNQNIALCYYSFPNYPDGLVRTSVRQLSYFLAAIINNGEYNGVTILERSTIKKMFELQIEGDNSQGLCWHKNKFESLWGHAGGDPGIRTQMFFNPETKIGIITFQNNDMGDSFEIVKKLYAETKYRSIP